MQTEVPTLPVVHFNANKNLNRKQNSNLRSSQVETKANSPHKSVTCFTSNKKNLYPLPGRPYQNNVKQQTSSDHSKRNKTSIQQRVLSAKMLRIKELQNQLADAHYQLNELANENRLLKSLQKKQDTALKRYEGTNAELPRIINSHHEELRILQMKYKKLKALHKETCNLLKDKETELQHIQLQNKHLVQLSKDRNLGEREKLQLQVSDLNHRIDQQQDAIQTLHRKLSLESKSLKQQLHAETSKRKETQKHLEEATEKLKNLENFLDNRERRLYYNGQLFVPNKAKHLGTQSLTNLRDISSSNRIKLLDRNKGWQEVTREDTLPAVRTTESNDRNKTDEMLNSSPTVDSKKTETMVNLEQIRKFRLQKPLDENLLSGDSEEKSKKLNSKINETSYASIHFEESDKLDNENEDCDNQYEISADEFKKIYKFRKYQQFNESLNDKVQYTSESDDNEHYNKNFKDNYMNVANNSRELHTRLISSADDTSDFDCKYREKLKVLVQEKQNSYDSDSEIESKMKEASMKHYLPISPQNFQSISPTCDDQTHLDKEVEEIITSDILNGSQKIYQNLINDTQVGMDSIENENHYDLQYDKKSTYEKQEDDGHIINNQYKSTEDFKKCIYTQSVPEYNEDNGQDSKPDEFENKQLEILFESSDKIEALAADKSANQTLLHPNENLVNDSLNETLSTPEDLNKEQIENVIHKNEMGVIENNTSEDTCTAERKNKLNTQSIHNELKYTGVSLNDMPLLESDTVNNVRTNDSALNETSTTARAIGYNKEKLLATMKAIDDNENIEFLNQDYEKHSVTSRKQITENLYRGLPTHAKKRQDIIKDIFDTDGIRNKPTTGSCSKLH